MPEPICDVFVADSKAISPADAAAAKAISAGPRVCRLVTSAGPLACRLSALISLWDCGETGVSLRLAIGEGCDTRIHDDRYYAIIVVGVIRVICDGEDLSSDPRRGDGGGHLHFLDG
jgi:hypothetical protein